MTHALINDMLKRPARQCMDGLNEIQFGIVFLLWGGVLIALELWGPGWPEWAQWSWLALILAAVWLTANITRRLRARWVYPRIGYVKWAPPVVGKPVIGMILGGAAAFLMVVAWARSPQFRSWLPVFLGLLFAAGNFAWWVRLRILRLLVYAFLALASGLLAGWTLSAWLGSKVFICAISVGYLAGGVFALQRLMRQPPAAEDQP
ncbi:MAG: hypothetical protein H6Q07_679 [Acidobacteria bacterium]|nr:hypothetical protein [Acidobacteriota bacterium]